MNKKHPWIKPLPIAGLVLTALALILFLSFHKAAETLPREQTWIVREETRHNVITISGNILAAQQQKLQAAGEGIVRMVFVREGDRVSEGQRLVSLDDTDQRYALANLDFQIDQERINGSSRKLDLMLLQRNVLQKNIDDRTLRARFCGTIAQLTLSPGDYVKAQDSFGYLIDRRYLRATVEVVETDAALLKVGQEVNLAFPAWPNLQVVGRVVSYPAVGRITSRGATVLDTEIRIDNPPDTILPGYSFTGDIKVKGDESILMVENKAIAYVAGKAFADRITGEKTTRVDVGIEPYGTEFVRIHSGLVAGDVLKNQVVDDLSPGGM